ncbi:universal stress protein [Colwellia sp. MB02u-6]|uniref:universal stress protein n=1 Tax=Colwellia sp. MB02u-6 TaxID=2759824 RepID=UPI0015F6B05E|nr:universal stress protein [Colwellia sp. MB02u-6]MBA6327260.1 universal stress protein [Colwellia sp. MB02u-6]
MHKLLYLVGVDGSEWSNRAVERAIHLAQKTGASVKLVYVITWQEFQPMMIEGVAPPPLDKKQIEHDVNEKILQPLVEKFKAEKVDLSNEYIWGEPVDALLQQVNDYHVNMLFVGRRGRSRFADILLGSVANKLAHCIGVPIVLVP